MSSANADVTVVVTCFNYGRFLHEAVDSALTQDGGPPNMIVVDDGSTDSATLTAIDELPSEVEVIRQPNSGPPAARNAGLHRAHTRYLIVLDADDRLAPGALAALRAPLDANPVEVPYGGANSRLGFTYGRIRFIGLWQGELRWPGYDPFKLLYRQTIGSTCLMRREVFEDTGGFDPSFTACDDWDFWLNALSHGWYGLRVPETTFEYRRHGTSMSSDMRRDYRRIYQRVRAKHAPLYARPRERELAGQSDLGVIGRAIYRWFWAWRPVPIWIERAVYSIIFRIGLPRRREGRAQSGSPMS
jgi:glycosyltransferase involved in cell wall biosynthesis